MRVERFGFQRSIRRRLMVGEYRVRRAADASPALEREPRDVHLARTEPGQISTVDRDFEGVGARRAGLSMERWREHAIACPIGQRLSPDSPSNASWVVASPASSARGVDLGTGTRWQKIVA
jgi:hypothetical protein